MQLRRYITLICYLYAVTGSNSPNASNTNSYHSLTKSSQPPILLYLHSFISVQPPRSTRSSSLVTLARPPTSSSLRITDRSFRYSSPCLWNQLPSSLCQPHSTPSVSDLPVHAPTTSSHSCQLITLTIHNSLSLSLPPFSQIFPNIDSLPASGLTPRTLLLDRFFWASQFFLFLVSSLLFCLVRAAASGRLNWLFVSFWGA